MKRNVFFILIILFAAACNNNTNSENKQADAEASNYIKKGDSIVKITFDTLRNTLLKIISEKGLSGAVTFCNVQALSVTSAYASKGITVRRVSVKNRNPNNVLSEMDKIEWEKYIDTAAKKDSLKSTVLFLNNEIHYYKPIIVQSMCLNCHGIPEKEIPGELVPVIDSLYPGDKATGYKAGDLRGMWHIVFTKK